VLGLPGLRFEVGKFNWIGRISSDVLVAFTWHTNKVKTIADAKHYVDLMPGRRIFFRKPQTPPRARMGSLGKSQIAFRKADHAWRGIALYRAGGISRAGDSACHSLRQRGWNAIAGNDCGFATSAVLDEVHSDVARAKLQAFAEGAMIASKHLW
jgi:hypothetical protein